MSHIRSLGVGSAELVQLLSDATGDLNLFISATSSLAYWPPFHICLLMIRGLLQLQASHPCSRQEKEGKGSNRLECLYIKKTETSPEILSRFLCELYHMATPNYKEVWEVEYFPLSMFKLQGKPGSY